MTAVDLSGKTAIVGLGITDMTRHYTKSAPLLAAEALRLAVEDAGLNKDDLDGLLIDPGGSGDISRGLHSTLGLRNLRLNALVDAAGSTAGQMVHYAAMAVAAGMASTVACVLAETPITPSRKGTAVYSGPRRLTGEWSLNVAYGFFGANTFYALAARRHMALYGTKQEHLGAVAVSNRKWASMNPKAVFREPMTMEDYHASRWVVEPLHLYDCCMINNGAIVVVVTSVEQARHLRQPPVYILGIGQGHPGNPRRAPYENEVNTGAVLAKESAFRMGGIAIDDVDICELYDCYTYTTIVTLEDYGFCPKGEGGPFVSDGKLEPGGALPTNTGGGHLSGYYMKGMTPISEAVIQARGQGGERQVPKHDVILVSAQGGVLDYHTCTILSRHPSLT